ncbi:BamA/TamA family outer membrane protein [Reichenbachiella carrageenanivorans]|uniref:BamA/TamA family outer membrane protein n=1 Tax=Reichenbachiella carrageenanivorans TaxID=2979869 RepID=A0ABY6D3F7_9BACT|nr:BamA/TamA family outer membrane protein [Reichenbachiella carrageenanivorans]UXX80160.1 BamA/TamA family outer membrane protein [Reichenbachiella carrageenanivorans]
MYRVFGKHVASFFLAIGVASITWAQPIAYTVVYEGVDQSYVPKWSRMDSSEIRLANKAMIEELRRDGYWLASIDSSLLAVDTIRLWVYQGRAFEAVAITIMDDQEVMGGLSRFPKIKVNQEVISPDQVVSEAHEVLKYLEANGYPFATLELEGPAKVENGFLEVELRLDLGTQITYDSLAVNPQGLVKPVFLSKYLGLDYGKNYDEEDLARVEDKIQHLPFLSLERMSTSFQLKKARVALELMPRKVNYFDGILGVVPEADGEGLEVTGELDLSINNLFQSGKKVEVNWKKLEPGSQQLHASYLHPILLGSPLDFYFSLDQIRQDTVYSNRSLQLAFDYRPSKRVSMRMSYESLLGNELDDQTGASGDFNIDYYGLAVTWYKLDRWLQPKDGFKTQWITNVGRKSVSTIGSSIPESTQYRLQVILEAYKRISPRSVLYLSSQNGVIFNDYLYLNDLYRLGGLKTIRGFNELEFFASKYALVNLEWRYYLDAASYLVTFYDQAFLSYDIIYGSYSDRPAGLGAGMQFATERGNFKILYGLGKRDGESFSFATSKIHFGYTAIF